VDHGGSVSKRPGHLGLPLRETLPPQNGHCQEPAGAGWSHGWIMLDLYGKTELCGWELFDNFVGDGFGDGTLRFFTT